MPEISLLEPTVLRGVVEKMTAPETMVMLRRITRRSNPFPTAQWDVIRGSRMIAKPNVPNSEAHIVPRLGRSQEAAAFVYLREKKVFEPTTIHWLREPGELAKVNAERAVMREVNDLNQRFDAYAEYMLWKSLTGTLTFDFPDVQQTVDYKMPASHRPTVGTSWATATPQQIVADIRAWRKLIVRDGRVPAREVFTTDKTVQYVFDSFANNGNANFAAAALMSDRMKDEYYRTGVLQGFMGLQWNTVEHVYEEDNGTQVNYLADDALIMGNFTDQTPIELLEGPTADDEAPRGFTGKFTKTWKDKDPSARQILLEWHLLPVITRPEQFVYVSDVAP